MADAPIKKPKKNSNTGTWSTMAKCETDFLNSQEAP